MSTMFRYVIRISLTLTFLFAIALLPGNAQQSELSPSTQEKLSYQNEISIAYLRKHLTYIASDERQGRETGTEGLKETSRYLAGQYEQMGLVPAVGDTSYLQPYDLRADVVDSLTFVFRDTAGSAATIKTTAQPDNPASVIRRFGAESSAEGAIVFAGFGVDDAARDVSHLGDMDLENKWVMVYEDIPAIIEGDTLVNPSIDARSRFQNIIGRKKALGLIVISPGNEDLFEQSAAEQSKSLDEPANMRLAYRSGARTAQGFSYLGLHPDLAAKLLGLDEGKTLAEHKSELMENISDFNPYLLPLKLDYRLHKREITVQSHNVAAVLEGSDEELKDEYVVLSAHSDHLGVGAPDSTDDAIYNGADDDGSGTVAMLNIAKALKAAQDDGKGPRRSVMFLHVSGEEKGLLGSRYYSDHPERPIEQTIANINIDMIGRVDERHQARNEENYVYIIGGDIISSGLDSLITVANANSAKLSLDDRYNDLRDPNQFYRRSDHWNFGRLGVPFAFFFSGVHADYHQPSDEIDKIRFTKMKSIIQTIYASVLLLAETDNPPEVDNQAFINATKVEAR